MTQLCNMDYGTRMKQAASMTAAMTCSIRAASFYEKDPLLKSDDFIALRILPRIMQPLVKSGLVRRAFMKTMAPQGIYEYIIARTKYIDAALTAALENGVRQIVFLGAGYDSRAIRFHKRCRDAAFFELDAPATQEAKRGQLQKRGIGVPRACRFIPIDFSGESPGRKLLQAGFSPEAASLFILEGLLMYLEAGAVSGTLAMMRELMSRDSGAVCDFIPEENHRLWRWSTSVRAGGETGFARLLLLEQTTTGRVIKLWRQENERITISFLGNCKLLNSISPFEGRPKPPARPVVVYLPIGFAKREPLLRREKHLPAREQIR